MQNIKDGKIIEIGENYKNVFWVMCHILNILFSHWQMLFLPCQGRD